MTFRRLAAAAATLVIAGCSHPAPEPDAPRPVLTQVVTAGGAPSRDVYSGELRARYEADLAFRVGGKLVARLVDAGARVRRGQPLARLDPADAKLAAQASAAQLAQAEGDLVLAKSEHERYADLLAKKFISASAYDAKRNALDVAQAKVAQMRSQAALSSNQAAYTTLAADSDGVIVSIAAEPGQVLAAGQPVMHLARDGEREVVVNAPEGQLARFHAGDAVTISLWSDPKTPFAGRVREIAGGADPVTRTYTVRVTALDPPAAAQLGMTANVAFQDKADASLVLLPAGALARDGDEAAVWVVSPASTVQLRRVKLGAFREDGITVVAGLAGGEVVVTAGAHKLRPDQAVKVASASPAR